MTAVHRTAVHRLRPITLDELDEQAALQTRVDRKYLVPGDAFEELLTTFEPRVQVLDIDGNREFGYRSVYFDTADLLTFRTHVQRRRKRFKVRTRSYLDAGKARLEVKTKGGRAETVKTRMRYPVEDAGRLTPEAREFVAEVLGESPVVDRLVPSLETRYRRTTLLDVPSGSRVTCDADLSFARSGASSAGLCGSVLVETKSAGGAGPVDRWLWRQHVRPESMSKYCLGVSILYPKSTSNPWHRILRRHFQWQQWQSPQPVIRPTVAGELSLG